MRANSGRLLAAGLFLGCAAFTVAAPARANVIQQVTAAFDSAFADDAFSQDTLFVPTSGDIANDVFASVGAPGFSYWATASAGVFGQVGLDARAFSVLPGAVLRVEVLVGSDEFVNNFAGPAAASLNFIVDGGFLHSAFSTDAQMTFLLQVGVENLGTVDPPDLHFVEMIIRTSFAAAGFPSDAPTVSGEYRGVLATDAAGAASYAEQIKNGLDLQASFDPTAGRVDIPLSFQSLDLGIVQPGERLLLGYSASILVELNGLTEGVFAQFSDPFGLSGSSLLGAITFTPLAEPPPGVAVPSPGSLLLGVALLGLAAQRCAGLGALLLPTRSEP